jgi:hypothetical protein
MPFLGNTPANTFVSIAKQTITGNGGTTYALSYPVTSANDIDVFFNNVRQEPTVAYSASETTITFTEAIASTDSVYVLFNNQAIGTINPPSGSVGVGQLNTTEVDARYVNVTGDTINGTLTVKDSTGVDTYFNVSSTGRITMPSQPAFRVKINNNNYVSSTNSIMPFSVAEVNVGGHFNTSTYRFTAPINGTYMLHVVVYTRVDNAQDAYPRIKVNGTNKAYSYNCHVTGITGRPNSLPSS